MKINVCNIFVGNKLQDRYQGTKFPKICFRKENLSFYPEGYIIHNLDTNDIDISKIDPNKKVIKGGEKYFITTDKLIFLLFSSNSKLQIENGKFKYFPIQDDSDILYDFYFEPSEEFSDYFKLNVNSEGLKSWERPINLISKGILFNPYSLIKFISNCNSKRNWKASGYLYSTYYDFGDDIEFPIIDLKDFDYYENRFWAYENYCSSINTLLQDHFKVKHELKDNKIKSKESTAIIKYNNEVVTNPVKFFIPNAAGEIRLKLSDSYDKANLRNCNFGNLKINLTCDQLDDLTYFKKGTKFSRISNCAVMKDVEAEVLDKCFLSDRYKIKVDELVNCRGMIKDLTYTSENEYENIYIHATPASYKDSSLIIKNIDLPKKKYDYTFSRLILRDYDSSFKKTLVYIEKLSVYCEELGAAIELKEDEPKNKNKNQVKVIIEKVINTNPDCKTLMIHCARARGNITINSVENIEVVKFVGAKNCKKLCVLGSENFDWSRTTASIKVK